MNPKIHTKKSKNVGTSNRIHPVIGWIISVIDEILLKYYLGAFIIVLVIIAAAGNIVSDDSLIVLGIFVAFGLVHYLNRWLNIK